MKSEGQRGREQAEPKPQVEGVMEMGIAEVSLCVCNASSQWEDVVSVAIGRLSLAGAGSGLSHHKILQ